MVLACPYYSWEMVQNYVHARKRVAPETLVVVQEAVVNPGAADQEQAQEAPTANHDPFDAPL